MSEEDQNPPKPTVKTSAVPLKKETVRITLRPQASDAPPPPATVPLRPAPPAPPRPAGGPPPPPATRPVAPPPPASIGSKTIPLTQAPPPRPAVPASPTGPIPGGPTTQALPKATVKLQRPTPTGPMPTPTTSISPTVRTSVEDDDEVDEGPLNAMGWIAFAGSIAAALAVLACFDGPPFNEKPKSALSGSDAKLEMTDWEASSQKKGSLLPLDYSPYDKKTGNEPGGGKLADRTLKLDPIPALPDRLDPDSPNS